MTNIYAVILAGGKGTRFWPLSTSKRPKQVLAIVGGKTLLSSSVDRLKGFVPPERTIIITSAEFIESTQKAVPSLPRKNIIGEPFGRDTAAACALAMTIVKARDPNGIVCILTADHVIGDLDVFTATLREGCKIAEGSGNIVTIGINPSFPSTGFGYIKAGEKFKSASGVLFQKADKFVEKPDAATARRYLQSGDYYWNSGMFIWSIDTFQQALKKLQPKLQKMSDKLLPHVDTPVFGSYLEKEYSKIPKISVDYAIMEKMRSIVVAKGTFRWSDLGSWPALEEHFEPDSNKNTFIGYCEQIDSSANVVVSNERLTAMIGVNDLVVVQAPEVTLICSKNKAQDVKKMVELLTAKNIYSHLL